MQHSPAPSPSPSFEQLYSSQWAYLCGAARRQGIDYADIEDVVQETYIVVHRRLPEFRGDAEPRTWLHAVLNNVCLNHHRAQRRYRQRLTAFTDHLLARESLSGRAEIEAYLALDEFLASLTPSRRELFVRVRIIGETAVAFARRTGENVNTLRSQLVKLDRELREFHDDDAQGRDFRQLLCRDIGEPQIRKFGVFGLPIWPRRSERRGFAWPAFCAAFASVFAVMVISGRDAPRVRGLEIESGGDGVRWVEVGPEVAFAYVEPMPERPAATTREAVPRHRAGATARKPAEHPRAASPAEQPEREGRGPVDVQITGRSKPIEVEPAIGACRFRVTLDGSVELACPSTTAGDLYWGEVLRSCRASGCPNLTDSVSCFETDADVTYCCSIMYGSFDKRISCAGPDDAMFEVMDFAALERAIAK